MKSVNLVSPFSDLKVTQPGKDNTKNLKKAAEQFETFFVMTLLKELGKTARVEKTGYAEETYMSLVYERLGEQLAKRGLLGIGDMIMRYVEGRGPKVNNPKGDNTVSNPGGDT